MPSTAIGSIEYDAKRREMTVEFVTSGRRYAYLDVPEEAYLEFRHAFAKGVHFNRHIRDRYRSELILDRRAGPLPDLLSPISATVAEP